MEVLRKELEQRIQQMYAGENRILVFGEGNVGACVMLIGEAPGEQETLKRRPLVGKAGKNLDEFLEIAQIDRAELYVTNVVKFRPTRVSKAGRIVNRPPTKEEIALFKPFLMREIEIVQPRYIVTLGNVPLQALTDSKAAIGSVHGRILRRENMQIYPMYHPASMIYNRSLREVYVSDVLRLSETLGQNGENR